MTTLPSIDHERAIVEQVLATVPVPARLRKPRVEFREDHSGEESIFLTFPIHVTRTKPVTPREIKTITAFVQTLGAALGDAGLQRFPYISLSESAK